MLKMEPKSSNLRKLLPTKIIPHLYPYQLYGIYMRDFEFKCIIGYIRINNAAMPAPEIAALSSFNVLMIRLDFGLKVDGA